jgi:hypothetical protein
MNNGEFSTEDKGVAHVERFMAINGCEWAFVSAWNVYSTVSPPHPPPPLSFHAIHTWGAVQVGVTKIRTFRELADVVPLAFRPHFKTPLTAFEWAYIVSGKAAPTVNTVNVAKRHNQDRSELEQKHARVCERVQSMLSIASRDPNFSGAIVQFVPRVQMFVKAAPGVDEVMTPAYAIKADIRRLTVAEVRQALSMQSSSRLQIRGGILDPPYTGGRIATHMKAHFKKHPQSWNSWLDEDFSFEDFKLAWNNLQTLCSVGPDDWAATKWIIFGSGAQVGPHFSSPPPHTESSFAQLGIMQEWLESKAESPCLCEKLVWVKTRAGNTTGSSLGCVTEEILLVFPAGSKSLLNYSCDANDRSTQGNVFYYDQTRDFIKKASQKGVEEDDLKINFAQKPVALLCDLFSQLFAPYTRGYVLDVFAGSGKITQIHRFCSVYK